MDHFCFLRMFKVQCKRQVLSWCSTLCNDQRVSWKGLHTIIADQSGDAFILEEGNNTNIVSPIQNDFIIMTNFPNVDFKEVNYNKVYGLGADRYICAHEYIYNNIHSFGINEAFEVLSKTF